MVSAKRIQLTLQGGAPWGFRLSGGGSMPLTINKIRKKSAAHQSGLKEGDAIIFINGTPVHDKSQDEALELVENSGDTLNLEIFRGDKEELNRDKPKKAILIGGGARRPMEAGLTVTATVDDVSSQATNRNGADTDLVLTASIDNMTSDSFATTESGFTATLGDVSQSAFDNSTPAFTMTASTDDVESSSFMMDSITAEVGDFDIAPVLMVPETQNPSSISPTLAKPFTDSRVIAVSPSHLSPIPPQARLSPQPTQARLSPKPVAFSPKAPSISPKPVAFSPKAPSASPKPVAFSPKAPSASPKPVAFSPKPLSISPKPISLSPKSPVPFTPSPKSPLFTSPKPASLSPNPGTLQPIIKNASPKPFKPASPLPSPKPSAVSSTMTRSTETFDDGQGQIQREVVVTAQNERNQFGNGPSVVKRETTTTTTTRSRKGPGLVKHQASAFETPSPKAKPDISTNNFNNDRKGPVPFSPSMNQTDSNVFSNGPTLTPSQNTQRGQSLGPTPIFKPSKFVLGQGKKDVPGLYVTGTPQVDVTVNAMYKDGKENVQPMFQVKNFVADKGGKKRKDIWKPHGSVQQKPRAKQQNPQPKPQDDFSPYTTYPVPQFQSAASTMRGDNRLQYDVINNQDSYHQDEEYDEVDAMGQAIRPNRLHIFAPPVEIHALDDSGYPESPYSPYLPYRDDGEIDMMAYHYDDMGPSSPDSNILRKKNLYSDSAFYDTPGKNYPTITEQMKLCKIIACSLTSQANRRARGAKMFMKRKRKSTRWIHDGHSEWSSSAGDVANLQDLDSELTIDDGGTKPLFYFKIPNLKNRLSSADRKMALTQAQFEKLRLQSNKCDHKAVKPTTCFDIASDLKASKGKGGRMFEKRKVRAEKFVIDDRNARQARPRARLENALNKPVRQETSPWNAAIAHGGNVDAAFSHLDEMERNQKLNQILKYPQPKKAGAKAVTPTMPMAPLLHTSLKSDSNMMLLKGKDFNRTARGWGGGGEYPVADQVVSIPAPTKRSTVSSMPAPSAASNPNYGDYNTKIKAWQSPGKSPYVTTSSSHTQMQHSVQPQRRQQDNWGQHSWHADVQRPVTQSERWMSQDDLNSRSTGWIPDTYNANTYKDEYDYTYVPVDYKFCEDFQKSPAYKQPIIPGTDL